MMGFSIRSLVSFTSSNIHSYIPLCDRCNSLSLPNTDDSDKTHKNDVNTLSWHMFYDSHWTCASYKEFKSLLMKSQRQPCRGVFKKKCPENVQQIYRRTPIPIQYAVTVTYCCRMLLATVNNFN